MRLLHIHCRRSPFKLKIHGTDTDTDTDFLADFRARILARKSARRAAARAQVGLPRAPLQADCRGARGSTARHEPNRLVRRLLSDARFSSRRCPLGMRACTRVRELYMINYRVHVYKITR